MERSAPFTCGIPAHGSVPAPTTSRSRSAHVGFRSAPLSLHALPVTAVKRRRNAETRIQGGPKKLATSKLSKNCVESYQSASEFRYLRQIKEMIKHCNIIYFLTSITLHDLQSCDGGAEIARPDNTAPLRYGAELSSLAMSGLAFSVASWRHASHTVNDVSAPSGISSTQQAVNSMPKLSTGWRFM